MIFSRLGRSLSRSSHSTFQRNVISGNYGVRCLLLNETLSSSTNAGIAGVDGGLGLVRAYLTSIRAGRKIVSNSYLAEFNFVSANPKLRRLFCSEVPKRRNYENYHPKDKKEIPKENNQKSEGKEESSTGDHGNIRENFMKNYQNFVTPLLFIGFPRVQKQAT
uniref:Uncharacterized protein n=1 Tax=Davidia involucrata TaxID=16924 RepID=A0A5B7BTB5_DAVIN